MQKVVLRVACFWSLTLCSFQMVLRETSSDIRMPEKK